MMDQEHIRLTDTQVLCVFHDATFELRNAAGFEERDRINGTVCVPQLDENEKALWLSCDEGRDRWYVYRGALIKSFASIKGWTALTV